MNKAPLRFKNGKFKIMVLGDPHNYYDIHSENNALKLEDTSSLLKKAIDELNPDLIVIMGDIAYASNEAEMRSVVNRVMHPAEIKNIPVSIVFGNHDHGQPVDIKTQFKIYNEHENFYTYNADDTIRGYGNCNLLVKASDSDNDILNLWFIDSGSVAEDSSISEYDWVHEDQIEWYKNTALKIAEEHNGNVIPALLFQHIPVCEEYELLREAKPYEYFDSVEGHNSYSNKRYVLKDTVEGYLGEGPCPPDYNSGEFAAWKEVGDVIGAFFGHDHMNDFTGYVDGIMLCQCKMSSFNVYTDGCRSGVRMITFDESNIENFKTEMYYFKDFGLKSKSLSPYMRNITDRQDLKLKVAATALGAATAVTASVVAVKKIHKKKNDK